MSTAQEYVEAKPIPTWMKYVAEGIGTFVLVIGGVGTAVIAGDKVGPLGVALAFGLSLLLLVYTIGPISGCHVNPAVTLGQLLMGRLSPVTAAIYMGAQVVGGLVAGLVLFAIANGLPTYDREVNGLGANGFGAHSPSAVTGPLGAVTLHGYGIWASIAIEIILTGLLVFVVLASTDKVSEVPFAGLAIGFTLATIHLISIPIDNTSVNPARSIAVAPYQVGAMGQLWVYIVFPLVGGALGAVGYASAFGRQRGIQG
ncbi:aquaporin [Aldersonia sp. NBC_00410]|uniref:aquaporin n=1 Tax=Aldersonia sp. NBC_00410 TaxID=2975954 RepID=UPI002250F19B|nr:aquaporin [Aldersonia sp. NBC_00410]MCX5042751.1 aquaporin [Aldersonia sp. NBC_00410]